MIIDFLRSLRGFPESLVSPGEQHQLCLIYLYGHEPDLRFPRGKRMPWSPVRTHSTLHSMSHHLCLPSRLPWAQRSPSAWLAPLSSSISLPLPWLLPVGFKGSHPIPDVAPSSLSPSVHPPPLQPWLSSLAVSTRDQGERKGGGNKTEIQRCLEPRVAGLHGQRQFWGTCLHLVACHPHSGRIYCLDSPMSPAYPELLDTHTLALTVICLTSFSSLLCLMNSYSFASPSAGGTSEEIHSHPSICL